jgi:hypothetical protein
MTSCPVVTFNHKSKRCEMYRIYAANQDFNYTVLETDKFINKNYVKQPYDLPTSELTNYWPFNNNYLDMVGNAHMYGGTPISGISFVKDRYGIDSSALYLKNAYLNLPNGVYISGDFTLSVWVKLISITNNSSRLLSISNDKIYLDSILFSLGVASLTETKPFFLISDTNYTVFRYFQSTALVINTWQNLVYRLNGSKLTMFIDGNVVGTTNCPIIPQNVIRNNVQFGSRSNLLSETSDFHLDELRLYNRSLTDDEIKMLF